MRQQQTLFYCSEPIKYSIAYFIFLQSALILDYSQQRAAAGSAGKPLGLVHLVVSKTSDIHFFKGFYNCSYLKIN